MLTAVILLIYLFLAICVARSLILHQFFPKKRVSDYPELMKGYDVEDISFSTKNNKKIVGWFIKAENNPENKTLVILHEWLGSRLTVVEQIKFFVDSGYNVFSYDQRSHGESDQDIITYGPEEGEDFSCALAHMRTMDAINMEQLGAIGFNMGGCGLVCCPDHAKGNVFKAMVLEGIDAHAFDVGSKMLVKKCGPIIGHIIGWLFFSVGSMIVSRGKFYHEKMLKSILRLSHTPKFFIQGENDKLVTPDNAQKIYKTAPNGKKLRKSEGAGHTDSFFVNNEKYKRKTLAFLQEHMA